MPSVLNQRACKFLHRATAVKAAVSGRDTLTSFGSRFTRGDICVEIQLWKYGGELELCSPMARKHYGEHEIISVYTCMGPWHGFIRTDLSALPFPFSFYKAGFVEKKKKKRWMNKQAKTRIKVWTKPYCTSGLAPFSECRFSPVRWHSSCFSPSCDPMSSFKNTAGLCQYSLQPEVHKCIFIHRHELDECAALESEQRRVHLHHIWRPLFVVQLERQGLDLHYSNTL